jgi:hypothetical protein
MEVVRKPSINFLTALSKIGGLMGLLRLSILLTILNEYRFTKKINAKLNSSE